MLLYKVFSYMFRVTLKPPSGCVHKIKDKNLRTVRLKYILNSRLRACYINSCNLIPKS